mmetsp:Transcript_742/g.1560  ORF Transcript_742/g.1560 Transcript_742/m.1560 type:complete len:145 (+) Transcript_742:69-503(+)|eukprot:CAMPEP_0178419836 /NCGR_PEP_ID=MMETSP0689_2-20121128/25817_1 /TAXON_ID=160604 /ORGANISM="Amphidinium massartii, Strain CS-259" /LENGTH=144 /DNA_ID=CAMNT_0020041289 /DNA_START=71 /DNA_END=505 /DNA_ORIENTATION=+
MVQQESSAQTSRGSQPSTGPAGVVKGKLRQAVTGSTDVRLRDFVRCSSAVHVVPSETETGTRTVKGSSDVGFHTFVQHHLNERRHKKKKAVRQRTTQRSTEQAPPTPSTEQASDGEPQAEAEAGTEPSEVLSEKEVSMMMLMAQ